MGSRKSGKRRPSLGVCKEVINRREARSYTASEAALLIQTAYFISMDYDGKNL